MANHTYQTVIDAVDAILDDDKLSSYTEGVIDRLVSFGYTPVVADAPIIAFSIQKAYNHVRNDINQAVPDGLRYMLIDMICGEFMSVMYATGQLSLEDVNLDGMITSVHEGDTTVNFGEGASDESKLTKLIATLKQGGDLSCYRRMYW